MHIMALASTAGMAHLMSYRWQEHVVVCWPRQLNGARVIISRAQVRYMVSVIQYGGRITDDFDQLLMDTFAEKFFRPEQLTVGRRRHR